MVFAFGSPEGLRNTVTMGAVSSVARQPDPDSPLVYVQTDTPINPGNSGGPLVDADGNLVGINTFILSSSGGNQGLGFAIPAVEVAYAYPQLLKFGHIHRPEIGLIAQAITPEIAAGLHLQRDFGVVAADVVPGEPADTAGLKIQDIILSVDGTRTTSLPLFVSTLYMHTAIRCDARRSLKRSYGAGNHSNCFRKFASCAFKSESSCFNAETSFSRSAIRSVFVWLLEPPVDVASGPGGTVSTCFTSPDRRCA